MRQGRCAYRVAGEGAAMESAPPPSVLSIDATSEQIRHKGFARIEQAC
jgi:hypothetical protein